MKKQIILRILLPILFVVGIIGVVYIKSDKMNIKVFEKSENNIENDIQNATETISASDIRFTRDFSNGYAWVEIYRDYNTYNACIDTNGNVLFTDEKGLRDKNGNLYYIYEYYYNIDTSYKFTDNLDKSLAYQFHENYSCIVCKNDMNNFCVCIVDTNGEVKLALEDSSNKELEKLYIQTFYNGYGTFYIKFDNNTYCINNNAEIFMKINYDENDNKLQIYPMKNGYFKVIEISSGFDYNNSNTKIVDGQMNIIAEGNDIALQYDYFVTPKLVYNYGEPTVFNPEKGRYYYNLETKKDFCFKEIYDTIFYSSNKVRAINDFSETCDYIYYWEQEYKNPKIYSLYFKKIDINGNVTTIYQYENTHDIGVENYPKYMESSFTGKECLVFTNDGYFCLDLTTGVSTQLFKEYNPKLSECYIFSNYAIAIMRGEDNKDYYCMSDINGTIITSPTVIDWDEYYIMFNSRYIGGDQNAILLGDKLLYSEDLEKVLITSIGETIAEEAKFHNGWLKLFNNFMNLKGEYMFN